MRIRLIRSPVSTLFGIAASALLLALALAGCSRTQPGTEHATPLASATQAAPPALRLAGPGAVVSFPLMRMAQTGVTVGQQRHTASFQLWQSADQLRVMLARDELDYSAVPANLPALMSNRGEPVRLLNISVWGLLWLVSREPDVHGFTDMRGRTLLTPFRRDMGAIMLQELYAAQGMQPGHDLQLHQSRDALDTVSLMLAGKADHAVLPEPTASLLLYRSRQQGGAPLYRVQSLQAAWAQQFPQQPELPQAGVMAAASTAGNAAMNQAIVSAYAQAAHWCKNAPPACAALAQQYLPHMPLPALEESIRVTRLDGLPAAQVRPQLEALYQLILDGQPEAIGGRLPAAAVYGP